MKRKFLSWFFVVALALIWAACSVWAGTYESPQALALVYNTGAESTPFATTSVEAVAVTAAKIPVTSEATINRTPAGSDLQSRLAVTEVVTVRKACTDSAQFIIWLSGGGTSDLAEDVIFHGGGETNGATLPAGGDDEGFAMRYTALTT